MGIVFNTRRRFGYLTIDMVSVPLAFFDGITTGIDDSYFGSLKTLLTAFVIS